MPAMARSSCRRVSLSFSQVATRRSISIETWNRIPFTITFTIMYESHISTRKLMLFIAILGRRANRRLMASGYRHGRQQYRVHGQAPRCVNISNYLKLPTSFLQNVVSVILSPILRPESLCPWVPISSVSL